MILKELNKVFFIGGHNLSNICSADDIVLRGDSEQKLKELLGKIVKESEKKNWPSILRNSGEQNGQLKYGNYTLEMSKLNKCRNLDSVITENVKCDNVFPTMTKNSGIIIN